MLIAATSIIKSHAIYLLCNIRSGISGIKINERYSPKRYSFSEDITTSTYALASSRKLKSL